MAYDPLIDNKTLYNFELNFLAYFNWITAATIILFIVGFFNTRPTFITKFNFVVKLGLALFLIYRFNDYRKNRIEFTELDRKICLSSGIYIFTISFIDYINTYMDDIKKIISPYTRPIVTYVVGLVR